VKYNVFSVFIVEVNKKWKCSSKKWEIPRKLHFTSRVGHILALSSLQYSLEYCPRCILVSNCRFYSFSRPCQALTKKLLLILLTTVRTDVHDVEGMLWRDNLCSNVIQSEIDSFLAVWLVWLYWLTAICRKSFWTSV